MPSFEQNCLALPDHSDEGTVTGTTESGQTKEHYNVATMEVQDEEQLLPEIQLACFHPLFRWAPQEEEQSMPARAIDASDSGDGARGHPLCPATLDFEKRAPYPTINLLRARSVRSVANQVCTEVEKVVYRNGSYSIITTRLFTLQDVTSKISENNEKALNEAGVLALTEQFRDIMK